MDRRTFIKVAAAGASTGALGFGGWLAASPGSDGLTVAYALERLQALQGSDLRGTGAWEPARALFHCGQSVVCSMEGYPVHKPEWFKETVGPAAFGVFRATGGMRHNTSEEVPGLQPGDSNRAVDAALRELSAIYERFASYDGELHAHFAYGSLSKRDYEIAHVLHLLDHLEEIQQV